MRDPTSTVPRRKVLGGLTAGAAALAFDPIARVWSARAHAQSITPPGLEGELVLDPEALREAGDDFGHIVQRAPRAVLRPASSADV